MSVDLAVRVAEVRRRIADRSPHPDRVRLIGVTKGFDASVAAAVRAAGVLDLGENYAQELLDKAPAAPDARWHFLGPVQRNKVSKLAPLVSWWHGVDRVAAGEAIARRQPGAKVLVQVNVSGSPQRPGASWADVDGLVDALRASDVDVRGLMAVATAGDPEAARREMRRLADTAGALGLPELSMGMSDDIDDALEAGSTMVRIGRGLLGPRPQSLQREE